MGVELVVLCDVPAEILFGLLSPAAEARASAAALVTDQRWEGSERLLLARVLVRTCLAETDVVAREAELHALSWLSEFEFLPSQELRELIDSNPLDPEGHLEYLKEGLDVADGSGAT
jgi:hypothetical protein